MKKTTKQGFSRRQAVGALAGLGAAGMVAGCAADDVKAPLKPLELDLQNPVDRSVARQKVIGTLAQDELHTFMRINFYGQVPGKPAVPLLSMNNYIIDYWEPVQRGTYRMKHYETGYYTEFDTDKPLKTWLNPITNEELQVFHLVLGPIHREYSPETVMAPGLAPLDREVRVVGDRLFVATEAISQIPNLFKPEEWPKISGAAMVNWLSVQTLSADMADVLNPELNSAPAHMQLQNFITWSSWMHMGDIPGGSMARGYGTEISGFDGLTSEQRKGFEVHAPEIFDTVTWQETHFDEFDYYKLMQERRKAGEA